MDEKKKEIPFSRKPKQKQEKGKENQREGDYYVTRAKYVKEKSKNTAGIRTLKVEAFGLGTIHEPDHVVRVSDGTENVLLFSGGIVGDNTGLQLGEVVSATADPNQDGSLFFLERSVQNLLDSGAAVLERGSDAERGADG